MRVNIEVASFGWKLIRVNILENLDTKSMKKTVVMCTKGLYAPREGHLIYLLPQLIVKARLNS